MLSSPMWPLLYSYRRCPYAMRARMALKVAGISYRTVEVSLRDKPPHMLRVSPKGTVPVLCLSEFEVIEESLEIMRWALVQSDPNDWLRGTHQQTAQDLLQRNDGPFKQALDRYKYGSRFPAINPTDSRGQALEALIEPLAAALAHQPFIGGQSPILHDVAVFPFVRQFAAVQPDWFDENAPQPVRRWLSHWLDSELFASIMQKLPPER